MRKSLLFVFAICLFVSATLEARAQAGPPPKVLSIFREEVKAARGSAHEKLEARYVAAFQKAKWPVYSLAMTASTAARGTTACGRRAATTSSTAEAASTWRATTTTGPRSRSR